MTLQEGIESSTSASIRVRVVRRADTIETLMGNSEEWVGYESAISGRGCVDERTVKCMVKLNVNYGCQAMLAIVLIPVLGLEM